MGLEDYFSLADAVKQMGVSRSTFYKLKDEKGLKFRKLGRRVFIKKADIERLLQ